MSVSATGTLDTDVQGATTAEITVTTETVFTMYVAAKTGAEGNYRIVLETSPDSGTTWFECDIELRGPGTETHICTTTKARLKVLDAQGAVSTVTASLMAE